MERGGIWTVILWGMSPYFPSPVAGCLFPFCLPRRLCSSWWLQGNSQLMPSEMCFFTYEAQIISALFIIPGIPLNDTTQPMETSWFLYWEGGVVIRSENSTGTHLSLTNNQKQKSSQSAEGDAIFLILSSTGELKQISPCQSLGSLVWRAPKATQWPV